MSADMKLVSIPYSTIKIRLPNYDIIHEDRFNSL